MKNVLMMFLLISAIVVNAYAFDGSRKGFILGAGVGLGSTDWESENSDYWGWYDNEYDGSEVSFNLDLKVGYGFSEQFILFLNDHAFSYKGENYMGEDDTVGVGLLGIGASYYFSPDTNSFYVTATIGTSTVINLDTDWAEDTSDSGNGYYLGFGYELAKHFSVEAGVTKNEADFDDDYEYDSTTVSVMVNYLAY